jgi:SAM-dependent methyltransferase
VKEQAKIEEFIQWDVLTWSKALHYWDKTLKWEDVHTALELGAREGGLSLWMSLKGTRVLCSDYEKAEATALPLHQKHGVTELISYQDIDATQIPYENHFDLIIFKSVVGGIGKFGGKEAQKKVFEQIYKALKPGGTLLFAENMASSYLHQYLRKKYNAWGDYWRYLTREDLNEFLAPFASRTIRTTGFFGTFGRSERQKQLFTRIDQVGPNFLFPAKWKYVAYGIAVKGQ